MRKNFLTQACLDIKSLLHLSCNAMVGQVVGTVVESRLLSSTFGNVSCDVAKKFSNIAQPNICPANCGPMVSVTSQ